MQLKLFNIQGIKKCNKCKNVFAIDNYQKYYSKRDKYFAYHPTCKNCLSVYNKKYRKVYWQKNKKKLSEKNKIYRIKNSEKIKKINKEWQKNNRKQINEKYKIKYDCDYLYKIKFNIRNRVSKSFYRNGFKKNTKTANILGADWNTVKNYIQNQFTDNMSWDNFNKIHIDHKIPLAAASTEFEVIALNHYTNLQPLWADDNLKKSDKYNIEDFKKYMDWYRKNIKNDRRPL